MITQFKGEDRRESIVNHFGFDIDEEDKFFAYIESLGYDVNESDEMIEALYKMWLENEIG